jgi:nitrogen fixation protein FixH
MNGGLKGWHVLAILLGFFGFVAAVNAAMIFAAVSTISGETAAGKSYEQGLHYNVTLREAEAQKQLGWHDETKVAEDGSKLELTVTAQDGKPVTGLSISGILGRPATNRQDRSVKLNEMAAGHYQLALTGVETGSWVLTLEAQRPDLPVAYRVKERVCVEPCPKQTF